MTFSAPTGLCPVFRTSVPRLNHVAERRFQDVKGRRAKEREHPTPLAEARRVAREARAVAEGRTRAGVSAR